MSAPVAPLSGLPTGVDLSGPRADHGRRKTVEVTEAAMDALATCPTLVIIGVRTVRCGAPVGVWTDTEHPLKTIFAGCSAGHSVEDMRRDINLEPMGPGTAPPGVKMPRAS
jgi:hypothetical protein